MSEPQEQPNKSIPPGQTESITVQSKETSIDPSAEAVKTAKAIETEEVIKAEAVIKTEEAIDTEEAAKHKETMPEEAPEKFSIKREILSWIMLVALAVCLGLAINTFILANAEIPTGSMETTVMTGDRIFGFRLSYLFEDPKRGDIVIFKYPDDESIDYLKRIIGLPGETVEIKNGLVYINDSTTPLDEPYVTVDRKGSFGPYTVPENAYFMMGDNRNNSRDSRYWENTFVYRDKIVAKALIRYMPSIKLLK